MTERELIDNVARTLNLCDSCSESFAECNTPVGDITFGSGTGNDNVIGCAAYDNRWNGRKTAHVITRVGSGATWWFVCGSCYSTVDRGDIYCRKCGSMLTFD